MSRTADQQAFVSAAVNVPPTCSTLIDVLRWRAEYQPHREAFTYLLDGERQESSVTYAELDRQSRAIATVLQSLAEPSDRALLLLPSGLEFIAAFFGAMYSGMTVVPLGVPQSESGFRELESIMMAAEPSAILTSRSTYPLLKRNIEQVPALRALHTLTVEDVITGDETKWRNPGVKGDDLALLSFTSGSTSVPKGVMRNHRSIMLSTALVTPRLGLTPTGRVVSWMPLHSGAGVAGNLIRPLYAGTPVTLMSSAAFLGRPMRWIEAISRTRATHSDAPNFGYELLIQTGAPRSDAELDLGSWEVAGLGSEHIRSETLRRFCCMFEPYGFRWEAIYPHYGSSEVMRISTPTKRSGPCLARFDIPALEQNLVTETKSEEAGRTIVGCGQPMEGHTVAITHPATGRPADAGEVGEIWVSGPGVAQGYWKQPEETERTFGAHLATGEGPYLRTGDLGFLYEGQLFITGRLKELIIIRGRNLYPQDIEGTVQQSHPALTGRAGAAFALDVEDEERLFVVQEVPPDGIDRSAVLAAMRRQVAQVHEIQPYGIILVAPGSIPSTSSGKIQRAACRIAFQEGRLAVLEQSTLAEGVTSSQDYVAPRTPTEATLVQVWEQILKVEQVGIHDSFFELGGDSLLGMQMLSRARQAGIELTTEQLLSHQTIASLAAVAGQAHPIEAEQGLVVGPAPLAPRQIDFFTGPPEQVLRKRRLVMPSLYEVQREIDPGILEQAVRQLFVQHDALRMRFTQQGDTWHGVYLPAEDHDVFSQIDLSYIPSEDQITALFSVATELRGHIDPVHGPLALFALFDLGQGKAKRLLLVANHLVTDVFSSSILIEDLQTVYEQLERGEPARLPPKTTSFKARAERLQAYAQSSEAKKDLEYWFGLPCETVVPLPEDFPGGVGTRGKMRTVTVSCSTQETGILLREMRQSHKIEIDQAVLMALTDAFTSWTGSNTLHISVWGHGRDPMWSDQDVSRTVGWFNIIFPTILERPTTVWPPVQRARSTAEQIDRIPGRGIAYDAVGHLAQDRALVDRLDSLPVAEVSFNYRGQVDPMYAGWLSSALSDVVQQAPTRDVTAHRQIDILGRIYRGRLELDFKYNERVFADETIRRLAEDTVKSLQQLTRDQLAELPHER